MRRLLLSAAALAGFTALGALGQQADAAVTAGVTAPAVQAEAASPELQTVQYYWHHRHYSHRRWFHHHYSYY